MFHKGTIYKKLAGVSFIFAMMAGLVYAYDVYGAPVDRAIHVGLNDLSVSRLTKYWKTSEEFAAYEKEHPPTLAASGDAQGVPVLLYHGIVPRPDRFNMTEATFKDQMFALKDAGYQTVTMADFIAFMREGKKLPAKSFLLTFDDGRRDSYVNADPILKAVGFRATMFVAVQDSMLGNPESYYIAPNDIRDMITSGRWDIESHAIQETGGFVPVDAGRHQGNFLSNKAWLPSEGRLETDQEFETRITRELGGSKSDLESFGIKVNAFAYPFGDYGNQTLDDPGAESVIDRLIGEDYQVAFRQVWPNDGEYELNYPDSDPHRLKRWETPTDWTGAQLLRFFETSGDKSLPYVDPLKTDNGWMQLWSGENMDASGGLDVTADAKSSGAATFLDGAKTWNDYAFTATIDRLKGAYVSLIARYVDGKNYAICSFGEGRVKLENVIDNTPQMLADIPNPYSVPDVGAKLGVRVTGEMAECMVDGNVTVSAQISHREGGIGVRVWDRALGNADIRVRSISIEPVSP